MNVSTLTDVDAARNCVFIVSNVSFVVVVVVVVVGVKLTGATE